MNQSQCLFPMLVALRSRPPLWACAVTTVMAFPVPAMASGAERAGVAPPESAPILGEVVVSARKRDESAADVPVSMFVTTGADIENRGIVDVEQTYGKVPGLYVTSNGLSPTQNFRQLTIRGVGADSQLEPSVATIIDGVYSPSIAFDTDFLDVERVEILKGPQGSLFGRNTEGGVLNIVTRKPTDEFQLKTRLMYDEFNTMTGSVSTSGPLALGSGWFGKLAMQYSRTDGYIKNHSARAIAAEDVFINATDTPIGPRAFAQRSIDRTDMDRGYSYSTMGGLRYAKSDAFEANLNFDYSYFRKGDQAPGPLDGCECYEVNSDLLFDQDGKSYGASATLDFATPIGKLTSISGWREARNNTPFDFDGTDSDPNDASSPRLNNVHDFDFEQSIFSEELRLASDSTGPLSWILGLYYFKERNDSDRWYNFPNADDPGGAAPQNAYDGLWNDQLVKLDREGYAVFGHASYQLTDTLELSAGGRWSKETVNADALTAFAIPGANFGMSTDFTSLLLGWSDFYTPVHRRGSFDNFSPSVSLRYKPTSNLMTYVNVARGFKAGSFQKAPVAPEEVHPIDPETTTNYEIGFKGGFAGGKVWLDVAVFHVDISDQQLTSVAIRNGLPVSEINNASSSQSQGLELMISAELTDRFKMTSTFGWTDTEFKKYLSLVGTELVDRAGESFPYTPEYTAYVDAEYTLPLSNGWETSFFASYRYVDGMYAGGSNPNNAIVNVPSWRQTDVSVSLSNDVWRITAFVDNVFDDYIILNRFNTFFIEPQDSYLFNRVAPPRRAGIAISRQF